MDPDEAYRDLYDQEEARQRAEYEREFGPAFREKYPFKPDGSLIHLAVMQQIKDSKQD